MIPGCWRIATSMDWFEETCYRKPLLLPSTVKDSCNISHFPILWLMLWNQHRPYQTKLKVRPNTSQKYLALREPTMASWNTHQLYGGFNLEVRDFLSKPCLMTPEGKLKSSWFHATTASIFINRPLTWVEILSHRRSKQIPTYKLMSFTWPSSRSACLPNQISSIIPVCAEHQIIYI